MIENDRWSGLIKRIVENDRLNLGVYYVRYLFILNLLDKNRTLRNEYLCKPPSPIIFTKTNKTLHMDSIEEAHVAIVEVG